MNDLPETSDLNGTTTEPLDYLRVKSSTCLLLTPSPTTLDFKHPLSEEMTDSAFLTLNDDSKSINIGNSGMVYFFNPLDDLLILYFNISFSPILYSYNTFMCVSLF